MYFPYLRAKQFELKALREFSAEHRGQKQIIPILEPVKQQTGTLESALGEMVENGLKFALILNPHKGDFKHANIHFNAWRENESLMGHRENWIPAFVYSKTHSVEISDMIQENRFEHVMIVFPSCMDIDDDTAWEIVSHTSVEYVVNAVQSTFPRRIRHRLKEIEKKVIRLDDCFRAKVRNADYALNVDELFSEEPFFYLEEGLDGYSDYTTLPSEYVEGGMLPYALAIHFSYRKNEEQLYVHHFVSDSNETNNDIRAKFREAAQKVSPFYEDKPRTTAVDEVIDKANDPDGYPGLGYLKKLSIKNHLELILSLD